MPLIPLMHSEQINDRGGRVSQLLADWSQSLVYIADFPNQGTSLGIKQTLSVYINNEGSAATITVSVGSSGLSYSVLPGQVGVFPIYSHGLSKITLSSNTGEGLTTFLFADFMQPLFAYAAQLIAQSVQDVSLQKVLGSSPKSDFALRTYDPDTVAAINALAISTGLKQQYDSAGNLLVSDPYMAFADGGEVDSANVRYFTTANVDHPKLLLTDLSYAMTTQAVNGDGSYRVRVAPPYKLDNQGNVPVAISSAQSLPVSPATPGAFYDKRLNFDSHGNLQCVVGEITLDGGSVTVETKDQYDKSGNLLVSVQSLPDVTLAGTPTVNIGAMPNVGVSGTVSAQITNTPTVNVGTMPNVGIDGTVSAQITNTPTVNIGNIPDVNIFNLPDVNIANTPNVEVTNIAGLNDPAWAGVFYIPTSGGPVNTIGNPVNRIIGIRAQLGDGDDVWGNRGGGSKARQLVLQGKAANGDGFISTFVFVSAPAGGYVSVDFGSTPLIIYGTVTAAIYNSDGTISNTSQEAAVNFITI